MASAVPYVHAPQPMVARRSPIPLRCRDLNETHAIPHSHDDFFSRCRFPRFSFSGSFASRSISWCPRGLDIVTAVAVATEDDDGFFKASRQHSGSVRAGLSHGRQSARRSQARRKRRRGQGAGFYPAPVRGLDFFPRRQYEPLTCFPPKLDRWRVCRLSPK